MLVAFAKCSFGSRLPSYARRRPELSARATTKRREPPGVRYGPAALGLVVGIGVVAPWTLGGRLLLLDWVIVPHQAILPQAIYGLGGGLLSGAPFSIAAQLLSHLVGAPATWLPILAFFPVAAAGAGRLATYGRCSSAGSVASLTGALAAGCLYSVNPFVADRLYAGQIGLLLGYALLPFFVRSLLEYRDAKLPRALTPAIWWTATVACSPHYAWIGGVVVVAVLVARPNVRAAMRLGAVVAALAVTTLYMAAAAAAGGTGIRGRSADLVAFQTSGDAHMGVLLNVLGLYGFWRPGPELAKNAVTGWPLLLAVIVLLAVIGLVSRWRSNAGGNARALAVLLSVSGLCGLFLALGTKGPTGAMFRLAYDHLPYFAVMREPQKFAALLALAEAVGFGWGIEWAIARARSRAAIGGLVALAVALPLTYEPLMFDGLAGQVGTSSIPSSWQLAAAKIAAVPGQDAGGVLVLPFDEYLAFGFTGGRSVANPAAGYFRGPLVSSDNPDLKGGAGLPAYASTRERFLEYATANGASLDNFGALVAPLGVRYVVLVRGGDWQSYGWLAHQHDLVRLFSSAAVEVFGNKEPAFSGRRASTVVHVPDWGSLLALSNAVDIANDVVLTERSRPGPIALTPGLAAFAARSREPGARTAGPAATSNGPGSFEITGRGGRFVELSEAYSKGWVLDGRPAVELAEGNLGWSGAPPGGTATFGPRALVLGADAISLAGVVALVVIVALATLRLSRRSRRRAWKAGSRRSSP